jgi:integrase/recombinase XerD
LLDWCADTGRHQLKQLSVDPLREFQQSWNDGAIYAVKNLDRLRAFFDFCLDAQWVSRNPVNALKRPKIKQSPTLPFSKDEMTWIVEACDNYPENQDRLRAFVLVMRYAGLRIGDAIALSKDRIDGSKSFLYTAKTGIPVYVPLPEDVVRAPGRILKSWTRC